MSINKRKEGIRPLNSRFNFENNYIINMLIHALIVIHLYAMLNFSTTRNVIEHLHVHSQSRTLHVHLGVVCADKLSKFLSGHLYQFLSFGVIILYTILSYLSSDTSKKNKKYFLWYYFNNINRQKENEQDFSRSFETFCLTPNVSATSWENY